MIKAKPSASLRILNLLLLLGSLLMLLPFIWMLLSVFKTNRELMSYPPHLFPERLNLDSLRKVWSSDLNFAVFFKNSVVLSAIRTVVALYTSAIVGFVIGKLHFRGRNLVFLIVLGTMMIPWPVVIIPLYQEMVWFGWLGSYWSIVIPFAFNSFGIFLMRQFVHSIPTEMLEAARLDGALEFTIFHRIVLPLLGPPLAALAIFIFIATWDDFLWPYLMLSDSAKYTIPIGLALFQGQYWTDLSSVLAGSAVSTIPVMIVYVLFQKRIIQGITLTGMK